MIEPCTSVEFIDGLTRRFWPQIAEDGQAWASAAGWLQKPGSVALTDGDGVFLVDRHEPGTYEVHTLFASEARPSATAACFWAFTETDCVELLTKVPRFNRAALALAKRVGFKVMYSGGNWRHEGSDYPIDYLRYTFEDWILSAPELAVSGSDVASRHDAMLMALPHQTSKAAVYYNRWARFYGAGLSGSMHTGNFH
jgi:hypothetical protein